MSVDGVRTIALCGDVMLGRGVNERIAGRHFGHPWGDEVLPYLRGADLLLMNLECAITDRGERWHDGHVKEFYFRADPAVIETLRIARVDCVSLANNHALDYGAEGLLDTIHALEGAGIAHVGAGPDLPSAARPAFLDARGLRVAVIGFADYPKAWAATLDAPGLNFIEVSTREPDCSKLRDAIAEARRRADAVIFSIHWGPNMRERPTAAFRQFAHCMADAGASIYWGHSAHVVQGVEFCEGAVILYDTGDFVDDYMIDAFLRNDLSALFFVDVSRDGVEAVRLLPVRIDDMRVDVARGSDRAWFVERVRRLCGEMGTDVVEPSDARDPVLQLVPAGKAG